jgi:hypothetical protein
MRRVVGVERILTVYTVHQVDMNSRTWSLASSASACQDEQVDSFTVYGIPRHTHIAIVVRPHATEWTRAIQPTSAQRNVFQEWWHRWLV